MILMKELLEESKEENSGLRRIISQVKKKKKRYNTFRIPSHISSPGFHSNLEVLKFIRTNEVTLWFNDNGKAWHCCKWSRKKVTWGCFIHEATSAHDHFKGLEFFKTPKNAASQDGHILPYSLISNFATAEVTKSFLYLALIFQIPYL